MKKILLMTIALSLPGIGFAYDLDLDMAAGKPKCKEPREPREQLRCPEFIVNSSLECTPAEDKFQVSCKCGFSPKDGPKTPTSVRCSGDPDDPFGGLVPPEGAANPQKCHQNEGIGNELVKILFNGRKFSTEDSCKSKMDRPATRNECENWCKDQLKKYENNRPTLYCCG